MSTFAISRGKSTLACIVSGLGRVFKRRASMSEPIEELLNDVKWRIDTLARLQVNRIDAMEISRIAQIPYYTLCYRQTLLWRIAELSRNAFDCFVKNDLAAAIILTRAAVETSSALWHVAGKIEKMIKRGAVGNFGEYLTKLRLGRSKELINADEPKAVHVNDFIRDVERQCKGFEHQYDLLSDYVHPNWSGTTIYSQLDHQNAFADFGQNIRGGEPAKGIGLTNLSVALMFFQRSYTKIGTTLPEFIRLCEGEIKSR